MLPSSNTLLSQTLGREGKRLKIGPRMGLMLSDWSAQVVDADLWRTSGCVIQQRCVTHACQVLESHL